MKTISFRVLAVLGIIIFFSIDANHCYGQSLLSKMKKKVEDKIEKDADDIINGKKKNSSTKAGGDTPANDAKVDGIIDAESDSTAGAATPSEIHDEDFIQNTTNPEKRPNSTRIAFADNLLIDMSGNYPVGYNPKWRFFSYPSKLSVDKEDWYRPSSRVAHTTYPLTFGKYNNKAVVRLSPIFDCECFADIVIKNDFTVLNNQPQTFQITNFRKILNDRSTGEACMSAYTHRDNGGGYQGKITLSANDNGDITMDFMMEYYSEEWKQRGKWNSAKKDYDYIIHPKQVSYRYIAKGITIENEMTAKQANDIVAKEQAEKQRIKDYMVKTTRQADSLQKAITKKYPQTECRSCFFSSRGAYVSSSTVDEYWVQSGNYAGSRTDYDLNLTTTIQNKCNYPLKFVGIQQLYDEQHGYYLQEVTKVMDAGYNYSSDQGAMASLFTTLIGGGSEFNFAVQDKYAVRYAIVGAVQWLKVIKN